MHRASETQDGYRDSIALKLKLAALCRLASKERDANSLEILRNNLLLTTLFYQDTVLSSSGVLRRMQDEEENRTLADYPVYHLALECGVESVPILKKILLETNPDKRNIGTPVPVQERNRFAAFALLYHIDPSEAETIWDEYQQTLDDPGKEYSRRYMEHPVLNPWEFPSWKGDNQRVERNIEIQRQRYPDRYPRRETTTP